MNKITYCILAFSLVISVSACSNPVDVSDDVEVREQDTNAQNDPGAGVSNGPADSTSVGVMVNTVTGEIIKDSANASGNAGATQK